MSHWLVLLLVIICSLDTCNLIEKLGLLIMILQLC